MQKYAEFAEELIRLSTSFVVLHTGTDLQKVNDFSSPVYR